MAFHAAGHTDAGNDGRTTDGRTTDGRDTGGGAAARPAAFAALGDFRRELYRCFTGWAGELFELTDAVITGTGPVISLPELSLQGVHRRSHGSLYQALTRGGVDVAAMRDLLADALPDAREQDGVTRPVLSVPVLSVDVTPWPRPDAECSPRRLHAYHPCRCDGKRQTIPAWPYQMVVALEAGATSWVHPLDAVRIEPDDDATRLTAAQVAGVVDRLRAAGKIGAGTVPVAVLDSGNDATRLAWLWRHDPIQILCRVRSDRVFYAPPPPHDPHKIGAPDRHGSRFALADEATWGVPDQERVTTSTRYGKVIVRCWHRKHQQLGRGGGWRGHPGKLPIVEGTLILLQVERLPGNRRPDPVWLFHAAPEQAAFDLDMLWMAYLRRFDQEHFHRFIKQTLGWTRPRLRTPEQADTWTWLILAAYTQLQLARPLATDLRRPWEKPAAPGKLTPTRVRRDFFRLRAKLPDPSAPPKLSRPGPGRPKGMTIQPAPRYPVGKNSRIPLIPGPERSAA